jgi:hypothetical protein
MTTDGSRWAALVAGIVGAAFWAGCTTVRATDGTVVTAWAVPSEEGVRASAAHDLGCPAAAIDIKNVSTDANAHYANDFVAKGCGWTANYHVVAMVGRGEYEAVQVSRSPLTPIVQAGAGASGPGCSKDTDCKGDRVCVQGQCADPAVKSAPPSPAPTAR